MIEKSDHIQIVRVANGWIVRVANGWIVRPWPTSELYGLTDRESRVYNNLDDLLGDLREMLKDAPQD